MKKRLAILGSTGSIGKQALQVVDEQSDYFEVEVLTAFQNTDLLIEQAKKYKPNVVVVGNDKYYHQVFDVLDPLDIQVYAGEKAIEQVVEMDSIDLVVMAIVGFAGLKPTLAALENRKTVALANKEALVVAGQIISETSLRKNAHIIPIDSEHSAIFQCLMGEMNNPVQKIILTASGGPFLDFTEEEIKNVTAKQALNHPIWNMGDKVSIDSATMINKGLEAIEAKWLFDLKPDQIEVLIHPQSLVHSMVYFEDASVKAQMGEPDMRIPIQFAMTYPNRLKNNINRLDLIKAGKLEFQVADLKKFSNLALAFEALKIGGNKPCVLNASNEVAVQAFLLNKIGFSDISKVIEWGIENIDFIKNPSLDQLFETDLEARNKANEFIKTLRN
ncbi:MAG: 1-deoxy-D-xylulose-5-phosphate reductoisomerase [Marinilabiliales bacterium]|nr:MAG: 1-deoxy-D-xylulose-5-phosphate reductoisomerase [Marinilabiliales bacterium]